MNTRAMQQIAKGLFSLAGIVVLNLVSFNGSSAPLPQKIISPQLQRHDCLNGTEAVDTGLKPYIQEFQFTDQQAGLTLYSCINWQTGFLKSEGIGKKGSMRAAELVARSNALKTLLVTNLNATSQFDAYFSRQKTVSLKIQNILIKNAAIEELPPDSMRPDDARVMATIPFYGISGLTSFLVGDQELYLEPLPAPAQSGQPAAPTEEFTGILFDVRHLPQMQPALLPNILSEDGEILYDASHVEQSIFETQGMIQYVQANDQKLSSLVGERPLIVKPLMIASISDDMAVCSLLAQAQPRTRRQGNNLTVNATNSDGQIPVNVVVSVEDAKKIKQLNETQQVDKEGKYTILIGGEIGGVKGELLNNALAETFP